ncbi:MAG: hypothetical protein HEP71_15730 [Roseivirga sp.]|nr:hypothetical protein [Roseivirga sp.]
MERLNLDLSSTDRLKSLKTNWSNCSAPEIDACFESNTREFRSGLILGKFKEGTDGKETTEYKNFKGNLETYGNPDKEPTWRLYLTLGVDKVDQGDFVNIFFELVNVTKDGTNKESEAIMACYGISKVLNDSYEYGAPELIPNEGKAGMGVSNDLVRLLSNNWLRVPPAARSILFYSTQTEKGPENLDKRYVVRTKRYFINKEHAKIMHDFIKPDSEFRILFGANPADFLMDEDIFTPIIEINNSESAERDHTRKQVEYLEFVQACPPFCGGGDG